LTAMTNLGAERSRIPRRGSAPTIGTGELFEVGPEFRDGHYSCLARRKRVLSNPARATGSSFGLPGFVASGWTLVGASAR